MYAIRTAVMLEINKKLTYYCFDRLFLNRVSLREFTSLIVSGYFLLRTSKMSLLILSKEVLGVSVITQDFSFVFDF